MQQAQKTKDKVSIRQLSMLYIVAGFSPAIRFLPGYTAKIAKEAGWVSPVVAILPICLIVFFVHMVISKSKDKSIFEVITDILGRYLGNFVIVIHLGWVLLLFAFYARMNGERLASTTFPNINMSVFIALTLAAVSYILRSGATAVARMGEFLTPIVILMFTFVAVFLLPLVRSDALLPVYFNDTMPILKASLGTITLFTFPIIVLMLSDHVVGKENTAKIMIKAGLVHLTILAILLIITIGTLGSSVTARASNPFLIVVKQISILDIIENVESVVIAMWLFSDSMMNAIMGMVSLNIMKHLFKLKEPRNLINILFVFVYFFSLGISTSRMELDLFTNEIIVYLNTTLGLGTPALLYIVGKIRKKI